MITIAHIATWQLPKIGGTILAVPIIRIIVFGVLYWGPLILGNYHMDPLGESTDLNQLWTLIRWPRSEGCFCTLGSRLSVFYTLLPSWTGHGSLGKG